MRAQREGHDRSSSGPEWKHSMWSWCRVSGP